LIDRLIERESKSKYIERERESTDWLNCARRINRSND